MALDRTKTLLDLDETKRYLGIASTNTTNDRVIDSLIMQASVRIQREIGSTIVSDTFNSEYHSSRDSKWLYLDNWPIIGVERVAAGRTDAITVAYSGSASRATVQVLDSSVRLVDTVSGVRSVNNVTFASNPSLTALAASVTALSGWTASVLSSYGDYPSAELVRSPGRSAKSNNINLSIPDEGEGVDYEIYPEEGKLYNPSGWGIGLEFNFINESVYSGGHNDILVTYTAGYIKIPEPLKSAALDLVKYYNDFRQKDSTLQSEKIGDYEYELTSNPQALYLGDVFGTTTERDYREVGSLYESYSESMSFASLMNSTANLQRMTMTTDGAGGRAEAWTTIYSNMPCRIQPMGGSERSIYRTEGVEATDKIFVQPDYTFTEKDRIYFGTRIFELLLVRNIDEMNHHQELVARELKGAVT